MKNPALNQLTPKEIDELVERLNQRPEIRVAQLESRIAKAREILARYERAMIFEDCDEIVRAALGALEGK